MHKIKVPIECKFCPFNICIIADKRQIYTLFYTEDLVNNFQPVI